MTADSTELSLLVADLAGYGGKVGARVATVVRKTAHDIEATAKAIVPVDTGNLRSSISTSLDGDGRFGSVTAEIGPTAEYGAYVEFGTARHAPAAYMGPALDRHTPAFEAALELVVTDDLR